MAPPRPAWRTMSQPSGNRAGFLAIAEEYRVASIPKLLFMRTADRTPVQRALSAS
jgi:hypothetical protein